jgi:hypothetical protein
MEPPRPQEDALRSLFRAIMESAIDAGARATFDVALNGPFAFCPDRTLQEEFAGKVMATTDPADAGTLLLAYKETCPGTGSSISAAVRPHIASSSSGTGSFGLVSMWLARGIQAPGKRHHDCRRIHA